MSSKKLDSTISIAQSHPNILVISSDKELVNQLKDYIEDYDYNFIGSADTKQTIKNNLINLSPNLVLLDTEIENVDLIKLTKDLEKLNIPENCSVQWQ